MREDSWIDPPHEIDYEAREEAANIKGELDRERAEDEKRWAADRIAALRNPVAEKFWSDATATVTNETEKTPSGLMLPYWILIVGVLAFLVAVFIWIICGAHR